MAERSILFSPPMIPPVMADTKTQTRRLLTPYLPKIGESKPIPEGILLPGREATSGYYPPRFVVGDCLWVRERYWQRGDWIEDPDQLTKGGRSKWCFRPVDDEISFEAPADYRKARRSSDPHTTAWHLRLGRFMPRRYSRTTLLVTDVRVQRLQDISEGDCIAEGIEPSVRTDSGQFYRNYRNPACPMFAYGSYRSLWETLNTEPGTRWEDNPWIVAVTFKREASA